MERVPMGRLTTHILDTANGRPAAGVVVEVHRQDGAGAWLGVGQTRTNADGRTDQPLLSGETCRAGTYQIAFHIGDYFRASGAIITVPPFLDVVPVRFTIAEPDRHYHVPLLASPWSYSTYRGS